MAILDDVGTLLTGSTVAGGATGWPLYLGHLPDSSTIGDKAVAAIEQTGESYIPRTGIERPGVQILVRGEAITTTSTAYQVAMDRALLIADVLRDYAGSPGSTGSRFVAVFNDSGPFFGGYDESWRPLFSANFRVWREST